MHREEDIGLDNKSFDKIRQTFKCPKFSGQGKDWKMWDKGFNRYLSIWELDHVINPEFFDHLPLSVVQRRDNKMVYYILEDAVQLSPLAASYVRQAPVDNGFEAYYTLHDGMKRQLLWFYVYKNCPRICGCYLAKLPSLSTTLK